MRLPLRRSIGSRRRPSPIRKDPTGLGPSFVEIIRTKRPNVIVQITPQGFAFTEDWFRAVIDVVPNAILLFWEGDAWNRWSKPVPRETRLWWRQADVVFTVALGDQRQLIERSGCRDVRFVPWT